MSKVIGADFGIPTTSAKAAYDELVKRTYDKPAIFGFARAARSWTKRDSHEWNVWLEVETMSSGSQS